MLFDDNVRKPECAIAAERKKRMTFGLKKRYKCV